VDPDLDDTRAARTIPPSGPGEDTEFHLAPDLEDTVVGSGAPTLPQLVEPSPWPEPAWPSALDPVASIVPAYSFRIGFESSPVNLDSVVFIGRKPVLPRIATSERLRLVTVESPTSEVSRTHLEIRQRGSSVIVTDLSSANGSTVVIPGNPPRRMRQGESLVVTPGTFIDIGDGNLIEILATRLRYDGSESP